MQLLVIRHAIEVVAVVGHEPHLTPSMLRRMAG
jgi:hypothetical protein